MKHNRLSVLINEGLKAAKDEQSTLVQEIDSVALKTSLDTERYKIENATLQEKLNTARQDREERKKYATHAFYLVVGYLILVFLLLILCGFHQIHLNDPVLLSLIATLAPNVLGIFYFVMKYLFSKSEK